MVSTQAAGRRSLRDGPGRGSLQGAPGGRASMQRGSLNGGGTRGSLNAGGASRGSLAGGGRASLQRLQSGLQRGSLKKASAAMAALGGLQIGRQSKVSRQKSMARGVSVLGGPKAARNSFRGVSERARARDERVGCRSRTRRSSSVRARADARGPQA